MPIKAFDIQINQHQGRLGSQVSSLPPYVEFWPQILNMIKRKTIALQLNDWWTIEPWACTRPAWQRWSNRLGQLKRRIRCSSSHDRAHVSTSSFSLYIWKIMLHGYLVNWSITFSGCTIMVSFPHLMPFEGVYIMFGSVVSYLPLMAQLCPRLTPVPAWMWWIECEEEKEGNTDRTERERAAPPKSPAVLQRMPFFHPPFLRLCVFWLEQVVHPESLFLFS